MNKEERVGFLRWIDTAANPELERKRVALVSLRELLREPPTPTGRSARSRASCRRAARWVGDRLKTRVRLQLPKDTRIGVPIAHNGRAQGTRLQRLPTSVETLRHVVEEHGKRLSTRLLKILTGLEVAQVDPGIAEIGRVERTAGGRQFEVSIRGVAPQRPGFA